MFPWANPGFCKGAFKELGGPFFVFFGGVAGMRGGGEIGNNPEEIIKGA